MVYSNLTFRAIIFSSEMNFLVPVVTLDNGDLNLVTVGFLKTKNKVLQYISVGRKTV